VLRNSFLARRHPVNILHVEKLYMELAAQFEPATTVEKRTCEHLAFIYERLEKTKAGTADWQRLIQTSQTLVASLEDSRKARLAARDDRPLSDLSDAELEAHAASLLKNIERLRAERQAGESAPGRSDQGEGASPGPFGKTVPRPNPPASSQPSPSGKPEPASQPLPEPEPCPYCRKSPSECAELKATSLEAWAAIHHDHPDEVEKRDAAATAEMFESLRRQQRGLKGTLE
jgi:hypothetical protein